MLDVEDRLEKLARDPDIVWGAEAIGKVLGLRKRQAHHFLATGKINAARKVGGAWCASRRELLRQFVPSEAA